MQRLPIGTQLGAHRVIRHVADGGSAEVYESSGATGPVAIKVLLGGLCKDPEIHARFVREGTHLASVVSPYVPRWRAVGTFEGRPFIAMDWAEGRTLDALLVEGPLSLDVIMRGGTELMAAVGAMHRVGLAHRDIKTDNIMVGPSAMSLLDLGVAAPIAETAGGPSMGAPRSWAPERFGGANGCDPRSDVYSLALVLYLAVARVDPFAFGTAGWQQRVVNQGVPPLRAFRKDADHLDAFFARGLAKVPSDRFPSASQMGEAWGAVAKM